jgi:hypothetical protein
MSHPPIPEQCNLFAKFNGNWVFMSSVVGCQVDESKGTQRTIVASVAECAWRREAERFKPEMQKHTCRESWDEFSINDYGDHEEGKREMKAWRKLNDERLQCLRYADEWRAWGEKAEGRA